MGELLLSEFLFSYGLHKRKKYPLRFALTAVICLGAAFSVPIAYNALYSTLLFLGLFFLSTVLLKVLCYDESWVSVLFCTTAGYAVQHIAFEVYNFIVIVANLNDGLPAAVYGEKMSETYNAVVNFIHMETYIIVYWLCFLAFGRRLVGSRLRRKEKPEMINLQFLAVSALTVLGTVVVNALVTYYGYEHSDRFYLAIVCMLIIFACIFALCLQFGLLTRRNVQEELDSVLKMWQEEEKQYTMLKDNIDYINVKCHDLKHQIRKIGQDCSLDEQSIREIQDAISVYDSALKTGNEALDVLLMEKNLEAHKKNIRLTCIADGKELSLLSDTDIYSLLGNGIDNAMEAVEKEPEPEKRVIGLYIKTVGSFLSIHLYNYCANPPEMTDGLPLTTSQDKRVHGYGMKSMKMIAEKYGGALNVSVENHIFNLDILIPV
jgi:hypothetical protein